MTNTEKRIKNQKIKETIKHIIHFVCYVLSVAFIILMVIVGAHSCSSNNASDNKPSKSIQNALHVNKLNNVEDYYVYSLRYSGEVTIDLSDILTYYEIPNTTYDSSRPSLFREFYFPSGTYIIVNGEVYESRSWYFGFATLVVGDGDDYLYKTYQLVAQYDGGSIDVFRLITNGTGIDVPYLCEYRFNHVDIVFTDEIFVYPPFESIFGLQDKQDFIFNDNFNYNAPSLLPIGNQLWKDDDVKDTFEEDFYSDLQLGWFYSNGFVFDTIRYVYQNSNSMKFSTSTSTSWNDAMSGGNGYAFYKEMRYYNSLTGESWLVNTRDLYWIDSGLGLPAYIYLNTTTWRDKGFTKITLLQGISDTNRVLLSSFNNNDLNSVTTGFQNNGYNGDIFSLLSSAFTSILPVLNIMVLPNITIGILMFVPLVAMLVFAIIRIIKK